MPEISYASEQGETEIRYARAESMRYEEPGRGRFAVNLTYNFQAQRLEERSAERSDTQIAELYEELAALAERRAAGDLDAHLGRAIQERFSQLRRLQTLQAAEIRERFRSILRVLADDLGRLKEANQLLRDRESTAESDDTSD